MTQAVESRRRMAPLATVLGMVTLFVVGFVWLWGSSGGALPGGASYEISFRTDDVKNTQANGEVRIAGVKVGTVVGQELVDGVSEVRLRLDDDVVPLHEGATVRVALKSIIGQSFVEIVDGKGDALPEGTVLSGESVIPAVDVDEVFAAFDDQTKRDLSETLGSAGLATEGRSKEIGQLLAGVGDIGREGYTAIDAIEAQNADLAALVQHANTIMAALNTGRDDLASLVSSAQELTAVTASQDDDLAAAVRGLPALVDSAGEATGTLDGLAEDLRPVAADLDASAPGLSRALDDLPSVTHSLRTLLDPMDRSLGRAPQTLDQVPALARQLSGIAPDVDELLANVNPMVAYLQPYGVDIGSFFGNFGASFDGRVENGVRPVRLTPIFSEYSVRNIPIDLQAINPLHWNNPYPAPGKAGQPAKYKGKYPHIEREE
ncbi:MlaD family protein [Nocardioides daeguensis]|uniref:Mce/MlaD domain-containing protein n=1 Tax=Nocardioides daeguensis TaxID=908359 RepID=A0ABP6V8C3_9ACTN|nr:MlaD family protein [Nocardioides daeguensis]MBV6726504.1 MCE family protein [Nocardioides daeguensis]MCR1772347.1 MCE family protein [Nocardioides daeguensis]